MIDNDHRESHLPDKDYAVQSDKKQRLEDNVIQMKFKYQSKFSYDRTEFEKIQGVSNGMYKFIKDDSLSHYDGQWYKKKMHGRGELHFRNNSLFIGYFHKNHPVRGIFYRNEGYVYIGGFKQNMMKQGYGDQYWIDGECFKGNFNNNVREGQGEYLWQDGRKYIGEYRDNLRHGYGEMMGIDGDHYKG